MKLTEPTNLLPELWLRLATPASDALEVLLALAQEQGRTLYLVGGAVRDLLLGLDQVDLDLAGEGEMLSLATKTAQRLAGRCRGHGVFGTVTVEGEGFRLDLAMARAETYPRPGALPRVRPASIREDLARRDFTVNAMALALCGPERGQLVDPFDGRGDIERGLVRVLHDRSFIEDATRILRAVRYEARLSFHIEGRTLALLRRDLPYLDTISGARLRQEFLRLLAEEEPEKGLRRWQELGVLTAIHPALRFDDGLARAFRSAREERLATARGELYLSLLGARLSPGQAGQVAARLALSKRQRQALEGAAALAELLPWLSGADIRPSQAVERLQSYPLAAIEAWALLADKPLARGRLHRYCGEWRYTKPSLDGRALQRLGVPRGPQVGAMLRLLKEARLDGRASNRQDEVDLVRGVLEGRG